MFTLHKKSALSFHRRVFRGGFCTHAKTPVSHQGFTENILRRLHKFTRDQSVTRFRGMDAVPKPITGFSLLLRFVKNLLQRNEDRTEFLRKLANDLLLAFQDCGAGNFLFGIILLPFILQN